MYVAYYITESIEYMIDQRNPKNSIWNLQHEWKSE